MRKILLVEDSADAVALVRHALGNVAQLEWVRTYREAAAQLERNQFDLILLDVTLPDGDGFHLCSILQAEEKFRHLPVILVTSRDSVMDKVMAFSVGADDYVTKPFDPLELRARIEARLRRREQALRALDVAICGPIEIDKRSQIATVTEDGETRELELTPIEFKILLLLASKPDVVFSRTAILDSVWGSNVHVFPRSVDTHVSKLRKKLGPKSDCIMSVHGTGYKMERPDERRAIPLSS